MLQLTKNQVAFPRQRLAAGLVDHFPLILLIGSYLVAGIVHLITSTPIDFSSLSDEAVPDSLEVIWRLIGLWVVFCFTIYPLLIGLNIILVHSKGASLGKLIFAIQVVKADETPLSYRDILIREVVGRILSTLPVFAGYLGIFHDRRRQAWHDKMVHTYVIPKFFALPYGSPTKVHGENI